MRKFIGPALVWSLKTYCHLSEADAERGLKIYREMYSAEGINMYRLYDGVYDTVKTLALGGVRLSVASGKPQIFLDKILETSGMNEFFERTAGVDFTEKESSKAAQIHRALISRPARAAKTSIARSQNTASATKAIMRNISRDIS